MTVKEKLRRDIKIFEMKLGLQGSESYTYEELAEKFNLSRNQVLRNVIKRGIQVVKVLEEGDAEAVSLLPYPAGELEKIRGIFLRAYQKKHEPGES